MNRDQLWDELWYRCVRVYIACPCYRWQTYLRQFPNVSTALMALNDQTFYKLRNVPRSSASTCRIAARWWLRPQTCRTLSSGERGAEFTLEEVKRLVRNQRRRLFRAERRRGLR